MTTRFINLYFLNASPKDIHISHVLHLMYVLYFGILDNHVVAMEI